MAKVFLSAGHGGSDPGAVGNGLKEKDINLQIMLADKAVLERHGVEVICSRLKDEDDPVAQEVREANASGADIAVSHHINSATNHTANGSESWYFEGSAEGKRLAELCEKQTKALGQNSRGAKSTTGLYFIRGTKMPAVITESAFIVNKDDIAIVDTVKEQQAFGEAYAKAILEYLGITYKPVQTSQSSTGKVETVGIDYAQSFDKKYSRAYVTTDELNLRAGANTSKKLIKKIPKGDEVQCYGYYTKESDGTVWLLVKYGKYTGFVGSGYLK